MAWLLPELEEGAEPELKPEFEFELDEPEFDEPELDEPELDEPELDEPEFDEPEPEEVEFEPELAEPELAEPELDDEPEPVDVDEEAALCVDPGRVSATMPAVGHAGHGDRRGHRADPGPAAVPFRRGPADPVSVFVAHKTHSAVAYSKPPVGNFSVGYESGARCCRPEARLAAQHEGLVKAAQAAAGTVGLPSSYARILMPAYELACTQPCPQMTWPGRWRAAAADGAARAGDLHRAHGRVRRDLLERPSGGLAC